MNPAIIFNIKKPIEIKDIPVKAIISIILFFINFTLVTYLYVAYKLI